MKFKTNRVTPFHSTVFEDSYWMLRLYDDLSLDVKQKTGAGDFEGDDYEHVYDFLQDHHETLWTAEVDNAIHRLAEHINYPLWQFEDWIADGVAKRGVATRNDGACGPEPHLAK